MRHTHTHTQRQTHKQRGEPAPCGEPDAELEPRTPGSWLELKADAQPLSHPDVPTEHLLYPGPMVGAEDIAMDMMECSC